MAHKARPTTAIPLADKDSDLRDTIARLGQPPNQTKRHNVDVQNPQASYKDVHAVLGPSTHLYNHLKGYKNAKQLDESVSEFMKRAPPLDSLWSTDGWLWVANPHASPRSVQAEVEIFTGIGSQYLSDYLNHRQEVQAREPGKPAGTITRMLKPERDKLRDNLKQLAVTHGVTHGKWMLFPHTNNVPQTWRAIVEAVVGNRLGDMAKIATGSNKSDDDGLRVICIYTQDFTNADDVKRVCRTLDELGLIPAERGVFYKADAYTHLNITSDNPYNIPASLYSSRDVLAKSDVGKGTKRTASPTQSSTKGNQPAKKKQATLDWEF